jgi:hypothetical protein
VFKYFPPLKTKLHNKNKLRKLIKTTNPNRFHLNNLTTLISQIKKPNKFKIPNKITKSKKFKISRFNLKNLKTNNKV